MTVNGLKTVLELNNIECVSLDMDHKPKKSIVDSKSFGKLTDSLADIKQALAIDVARAAEKLRRQNSVTSFIAIFIRTDPFKTHYYSKSIGIKLPYPISDTPTLIKYATFGLEKIFIKGYKYKKAGVMLTAITQSKDVQLNFSVDDYLSHIKRYEKITESIDRINKRWGRDTIKVASMGVNNNLKMRQEMKSPQYTTNLEELLNVYL